MKQNKSKQKFIKGQVVRTLDGSYVRIDSATYDMNCAENEWMYGVVMSDDTDVDFTPEHTLKPLTKKEKGL